MNIKTFRHLITLFTVAAAIATATTSCSDNDMPAAPDTPVTDPAELPGVIRFSLASLSSRVSSDGLTSRFEPGDKIGCIIVKFNEWQPQNSEYWAASAWEVNERRFIELKKLKKSGSDQWIVPDENDDIITPLYTQSGHQNVRHEYIQLKNEWTAYGFLFYYPFIENEDIRQELLDIVADYNGGNTAPVYDRLSFPNCATNTTLKFGAYGNNHGQEKYDISNSGPNYENVISLAERRIFSAEINNVTNEDVTWPVYGWNEYPVFASVNQRNASAHQLSDFMCATRFYNDNNQTITSSSTNTTLEVKFRKKHAAIEVISDDTVSDLHLYYSDADEKTAWKSADYTWDGFLVGRKYNLLTETFSEWFPDKNPVNHNSDRIGRNYIQKWPEEIYPYEIDKGHHYRVILPPQPVPTADNTGFLQFTDADGVAQSLPLSKLIRVSNLEENKLYIIRLKKGFWTIEIHDWVTDCVTDLEEV